MGSERQGYKFYSLLGGQWKGQGIYKHCEGAVNSKYKLMEQHIKGLRDFRAKKTLFYCICVGYWAEQGINTCPGLGVPFPVMLYHEHDPNTDTG